MLAKKRKEKNILLDFQAVLERKVFAVDPDAVFSVTLFSETDLLSCWLGKKPMTYMDKWVRGRFVDSSSFDSTFLCCILFVNRSNYLF